MKVMIVETQYPKEVEELLEIQGILYTVEYVPSDYNKQDHFGEVYADTQICLTQFSFFNEEEFEQILTFIQQAEISIHARYIDHKVRDYQQQFEDTYPTTEVGQFLILPPWRNTLKINKQSIIIEPSTGFGTGQSPTTKLCLEWLSKQSFKANERILDFGSGSGILAIASAKRGSKSVIGLEIDTDAIKNAQVNVTFNDLEKDVHIVSQENGEYDILIMNVTREIFKVHFDNTWQRVQHQGYISGIRFEQKRDIEHFLDTRQIKYRVHQLEGWCGFEVWK